MRLKAFEIYNENIVIRFLFLGLMLVLNLEKEINVFLVTVYLLSMFILTLSQDLISNEKVRMCLYFIALIISILFIKVNFSIGIVGAICLVTELAIQVKYCSLILLVGMFILVISKIGLENNILYLVVSAMIIYFTKDISDKRKVLEKERIRLESLKEKFYNNVKIQKDYKSLNEKNIILAKLEERNRIGSGMHDKIGHVLAGSIMRLEAAKIVIESDKVQGVEIMNEAIANLRTGMDDIRNIIHKITPKTDEIGINKIKKELENKFLNSNIKTNIAAVGNIDKIRLDKWLMFEKIIIELSTNTLKYSKCKNIYVNFEVLNKIIRFSFKDDGIGSGNFKKGFGLSKIEEEVIRNNGAISINSLNGFEIVITLKI